MNDTTETTTEVTDFRGRFTDVDKLVRFAQAGKSTLTLKSTKTEKRFTYRITESEDGRKFFVALLNGPDNENDYQYLGFLDWGKYVHGSKSKVSKTAASVVAFTWAWNHFAKGRIPEGLEVWHEGRCGRCNHKLTVPESIETGFGPECSQIMGLVRKAKPRPSVLKDGLGG